MGLIQEVNEHSEIIYRNDKPEWQYLFTGKSDNQPEGVLIKD